MIIPDYRNAVILNQHPELTEIGPVPSKEGDGGAVIIVRKFT
jgi:hypothetical protein